MGSPSSERSLPRRLVSVLLLIIIGYVGARMIPIAISTFQFSQAMSQEVMYGPVNEPASFIHERLINEARHLGLPLDPQRVVVEKRGANLRIHATYTVRVDFLEGVGFDWYFHPDHTGTRRPPAFGG